MSSQHAFSVLDPMHVVNLPSIPPLPTHLLDMHNQSLFERDMLAVRIRLYFVNIYIEMNHIHTVNELTIKPTGTKFQ